MYRVGILEAAGGQVAPRLQEELQAAGRELPMLLTCGERFSCFRGTYDLFVVAATAAGAILPPDVGNQPIQAGILLVPGSAAAELMPAFQADCVVTYGLSGKDSITLSSLNRHTAVLALQREFRTLLGEMVGQQEIPIRFAHSMSAPTLMAVYGCLYALGIFSGAAELCDKR